MIAFFDQLDGTVYRPHAGFHVAEVLECTAITAYDTFTIIQQEVKCD